MKSSICSAISAFIVLATPSLRAQSGIGFRLVAEPGTAMPGQGGVAFDVFSHPPAIDGGTVAFVGESGLRKGIYTWSAGNLNVIADTTMQAPRKGGSTGGLTPGLFAGFHSPSMANGRVSFSAGALFDGGVYSSAAVGVAGVVTYDDALPAQPDPLNTIVSIHSEVSVSSIGWTALSARRNLEAGLPWRVYYGSPLIFHELINEQTPLPEGVGNFSDAGLPSAGEVEGELRVAVRGTGSGGQQGIYRFWPGHPGGRVADTTTLIPEGTGAFTSFGDPVLNGALTAFQGFGANGQFGIYLSSGGALARIVDGTTSVPSSSGVFLPNLGTGYTTGTAIPDKRVGLDNGNIAFFGGPSAGTRGIYLFTGATGTLALLQRQSGKIDGRPLESLVLGHEGLDGRQIALLAQFEGDSDTAIYVAECASFAVSSNGAWDAAANWTFNAVPGPQSATLISTSASVLGPAEPTTVRGLEVISFDDDEPSMLVLQSGGKITVSHGAQVSANGVLAGSGVVAVGAGQKFRVEGNGNNERATLSPGGTALAHLTVEGDVELADYSQLRVNANAAGQRDTLTVNGNLKLAPTSRLAITLLDAPSGEHYPLVQFTGTLDGAFGSVTGLPAGYSIDYSIPGRIILKSTSSSDSDIDGIPDPWELSYTPDLTTFDASSDTDNDGMTDLAEYFADTDPLDPSQNLQVLEVALDAIAAEIELSWTSRTTCRYRVESAPTPAGPWLEESGLLDPDPGPATTRRISVDGAAPRFFRVTAVRAN